MTKRVFSLLMALALCLSLLPAPAWAAESGTTEPGENPGTSADAVAQVGNQIYDTLSDAIAAAAESENSTVTLLKDAESSAITVNSGTFTIDLNNHTYTLRGSGQLFTIGRTANVTFKNGKIMFTEEGSGNHCLIYVDGYAAKLTLEGMNIVCDNATDIRVYNGKLTVRSGEYGQITVNKITRGSATLFGGSYADLMYNGDSGGSGDYSKLLADGYIFEDVSGNYIAPDTMGLKPSGDTYEWMNIEAIKVVECNHQGAASTDGKCERCGYVCPHENVNDKTGECATCGKKYEAAVTNGDTTTYYEELDYTDYSNPGALWTARFIPGCTVTMYTDTSGLTFQRGNSTTAPKHTLDANGHKITGTLLVWYAAEMTVKTATEIQYVQLNDATLSLEDSTVSGQFDISGKATLTNCTVSGITMLNSGSSKLTISGNSQLGTINLRWGGTLDFQSGTAQKIYRSNYTPVITVSGGTITELDARNCDLTLSGGSFGTIKASKNLIDCVSEGKAFFDANNNVVKGNENTLSSVHIAEHSTCDFNTADHVCACGRFCTHQTWDNNGKCSICGKQAEAKIGDAYYNTLADAVGAAANNDTVTLIANSAADDDLTISKPLTITGSGKYIDALLCINSDVTLSGTLNCRKQLTVNANGKLTVQDNPTFLGMLTVNGGSLTVAGGNFYPNGLTLNNPQSVQLSGGVFGNITISEGSTLTLSDLLLDGYSFKSSSGSWATTDQLNSNTISNVEVKQIPLSINPVPSEGGSWSYGSSYALNMNAQALTDNKYITYVWKEGGNTLDCTTGSYQVPDNTAAGEHTYTCTATCDGYSLSHTFTVTITQSGATLGETVKTYLGNTEQSRFTYGDTITVKATPSATGIAPATQSRLRGSAPSANQMAVFWGEKQVSDAVDPNPDGSYTMTVDSFAFAATLTADKDGGETYQLTAKFVGNDNMTAAEGTVTVTLYWLNTEDEAELSGTKGENGWYTSGVTLSKAGYELEYNLAAVVPWHDSLSWSGPVIYKTVYYMKNAQGQIAKKSIEFKIDTTAPTLGDPTVTATDSNAEISVTASAGLSGINADSYAITKISGDGSPTAVYQNGHFVITGLLPNHEYKFQISVKNNAGIEGKREVTVKTVKRSLANATVSIERTYSYTGSPITPTVTVKDGETIIPAEQYTVTCADNINTGTATVTVTANASSDYSGTASGTFIIQPKSLTANVTVEGGPYTYTGSAITPTVTVKDGGTIISSDEYDVVYADNLHAGTATVTITDKTGGNYTVTGSTTFAIGPKSVTDPTVTVVGGPYTYNGSAITPAVTVKDGEITISPSEYAISCANNIQAGTAIVTITNQAGGDYTVTGSTTFTISKAQATVTVKNKTAYVGSTAPDLLKPELDKDYTVSGLFGQDKLPETPTLKYVNAAGEEITPDMTKTGDAAVIQASGAAASENYEITYVSGKLTVSRRSSSSSSGSSTPSTPGKTETTTNPDGSIKITPPKNSGKVKVEIPVKDVTAGTVAIIVKPDGTEEIVKDALPTKNGIELTVEGEVTVKIVDNAKDFADTKGHWAEDAIDFVSARGLVNGVSETNFAPNAPTTRAQLWTILARQADADLTGGSTWYEKAQEWAKTSGISDGSDPNGNITRAQMVTMLWRAAGSPAVTDASGFTDVPAESYYAQAVAWAAQHGITTGVGAGKFDPNGTCTRAQIATFLYRTYVNR